MPNLKEVYSIDIRAVGHDYGAALSMEETENAEEVCKYIGEDIHKRVLDIFKEGKYSRLHIAIQCEKKYNKVFKKEKHDD